LDGFRWQKTMTVNSETEGSSGGNAGIGSASAAAKHTFEWKPGTGGDLMCDLCPDHNKASFLRFSGFFKKLGHS
jgi:hypothetical protein